MNADSILAESLKAIGIAGGASWVTHWLRSRNVVATAKLTHEERLLAAIAADRDAAAKSASEARELLERTRAEMDSLRQLHLAERTTAERKIWAAEREAAEWKQRATDLIHDNERMEVRLKRLEEIVIAFRKRFKVTDADSDPTVSPLPEQKER